MVGIKSWDAKVPDFELTNTTNKINEYESGAFYKRELPCLLETIQKIEINPKNDIIVIDGYVILSDEGKLGLGGYLFEKLNKQVPVIGVAKNDYVTLQNLKGIVYRGISKKPLYVSSLGLSVNQASKFIRKMHGQNRLPTILKLVDKKSREF